MDNGAFELGKSYDAGRLLELGQKCKADAIVLPDFPGKPCKKTIDASEAIVDSIKAAGFRTMFVPQSERGNMADWIAGYQYAATNDDIDIIGMSILGIPNAIPVIDRSFCRVAMSLLLIQQGIFNFDKHHHYLGLNGGPGLEIPSLLRLGALDTCDSSNPIWTGILGHEYTYNADSLSSVKKPKILVDFDLPYIDDSETHRRIQTNIDMTLELFK